MKTLNKHVTVKKMINEGIKYEDISKETGLSLGLISNVAKKSIDLDSCEVKKAVIWAAGWGSRMMPVTKKTPKPLIKVKDNILIETIINSLMRSGIEDITIVIGKDHHAFSSIIKKHNLKYVINPTWQKHNNISSFYAVMHKIKEPCYFIDGDLFVENDFRFATSFKNSFIYSSWVDNIQDILIKKTGTWVSGYEKPADFKGITKGYQYKGIFALNQQDIETLKEKVKEVFSPLDEYNSLYWFDPLFDLCHTKSIDMEIEQIDFNKIIELDTLEDLISFDPKNYPNVKHIKEKYND